MQSTYKLLAVAAAAMLASVAHADVSFNANLEHDITKAKGQDVASTGRVEINAVAALAKNGDRYVNAKATLLVPTGSGADVGIDDAWLEFGNASLGLKIGRFEAADLGPIGKDTVVASRAAGYNGNTLRGRIKTGQVHTALTFNASESLKIELGLVTKKDAEGAYGVRPVLIYAAGPVSLKAGFESMKTAAGVSQTGVAGNVAYDLGGGANVGLSYGKNNDSKAATTSVYTNIGPFGAGLVHDDNGAGLSSNVLFAAYTLPLFDIKGASITPAFSTSKFSNGVTDNAFKVRFNYAF